VTARWDDQKAVIGTSGTWTGGGDGRLVGMGDADTIALAAGADVDAMDGEPRVSSGAVPFGDPHALISTARATGRTRANRPRTRGAAPSDDAGS
jgi:hypothetical protein